MLLFFGFLVLLVFTVDGELKQAGDEEFPFQVSIQKESNEHLCGGVIIAPRWVLTSSMCLTDLEKVSVVYGTVHSRSVLRSVMSERIEHEPVYVKSVKNRLAVIQIESPIEVTPTSGQAYLPSCCTELKNTTKLSGWKAEGSQPGAPATLYVVDTYSVMSDYCTIDSLGGATIKLSADEFCGMDENKENKLLTPGSVVTLNSILLGMLAFPPVLDMPPIFLRLSRHEQWIKNVLGADADSIKWVEKLPSDSATKLSSQSATIAPLLGISTFLLRLI